MSENLDPKATIFVFLGLKMQRNLKVKPWFLALSIMCNYTENI